MNEKIKKILSLVLILIIFDTWTFSQKIEIEKFISDFDIFQNNLDKTSFEKMRIYESDSTFFESFIIDTFFYKVIGDKWYIYQDSLWKLFFDDTIKSYATFKILNVVCSPKWKRTSFYDCSYPVYELNLEPIEPTNFIIDIPRYLFTVKDGIILIYGNESNFLRKDKIDIGLKILRN